MASPQVENGYTRIANELLENLHKAPISGSEFRIMLMVLRKTYGFGKKIDWISLTQLEEGTGLKRANVCKTIKTLVVKRLLLKSRTGIGINKDFNDWVVVKRLPPPASSQLHNLGVVKRLHTKETNTKESMFSKKIKKVKKTMADLIGKEILVGEAPKTGTPSPLDMKVPREHRGSEFGGLCLSLGRKFNEYYKKRFTEDYKKGSFSVSGIAKNISKYKEYKEQDWIGIIDWYFRSKKSKDLVVTLEACFSENTILEYRQKNKKQGKW